tara:strand:+ start:156 stop:878 length:723 start_codon:yes stop_codon:yes gene_type:complete
MEQDYISNLDVLILCGGFGKRLKEIGQNCPKPMVEINGRPFLEILIEHISSFGFRRYILCAGFKSEVIEQYFQKKNDDNTYILSKEDEPLGTGGGIKKAESCILGSTFIVLNGDSICRANLNDFVEFHESNNASVSMAVATIDDVSEYGSVVINDRSEINGFKEKSDHIKGQGLINAGIYLFKKPILDQIPSGQNISLEKEVLPSMIGQKFYGFKTTERLFDIGTPQRLEILRTHIKLTD